MDETRCRQKCVYWEPFQNNYGDYSYYEPVELKCRHEKTNRVSTFGTDNETEILYSDSVYTFTEVKKGGKLWLGEIKDLQYDLPPHDESRRIKSVSKTPTIRTLQTLYEASM